MHTRGFIIVLGTDLVCIVSTIMNSSIWIQWHSFMECPLVRSQRREFILSTKLTNCFECDSSVENFALLVARVREDKKLANALARFARQIHDSRQCWFRQLSSEATETLSSSEAQMLETSFNI